MSPQPTEPPGRREGEAPVEFGVLGEVRARVDGRAVDLGPAQRRRVLAVLLVEANHSVPCDQLIDRVWGAEPPAGAAGTLRTYVSRLRAVLPATERCGIGRRSGGYVLDVDEDAVDLHRFRRMLAQARADEDDGAAARYERALELWRGAAFADLDSPWLAGVRQALHDERFAARLDYHDVQLRRGEHTALLPALTARTGEHPLDERLAGQFILALYRSGRQAEALERYERLRSRLAEELGADPVPDLQRLHRQILTADVVSTARPAPPTRSVPVPRQLPAPPPRFTGRARELGALDHAVGAGTSVPIAAIGGPGGIGKTWLALHWAYRHLDEFPDGQLYVNLRGFDPLDAPLSAGAAVRVLLDGLGVDAAAVPADDLDAQTGLYRSLVAGRRMLIMLDNARSTAQVAPLLPGGSSCAVLVTSRHELVGLLTGHAADPVRLDALDPAEARDLLVSRLGAARVDAEPRAAADLLDRCAGLPLALSIIAARANLRPGFSLAVLAGELHQDSAGLDAFDAGELNADLRAVFSCSYRTLARDDAGLFRLLAVHPGPDFTPESAAALAAVPVARARQTLLRLAAAHLVQPQATGRSTLHDLIRLYAAERVTDAQDRAAAFQRLGDWYVRGAHAAALTLAPDWLRSQDPPCHATVREGVSFTDRAQATRWLEAEHVNLLAVLAHAAEHGPYRIAWLLAESLRGYFWWTKRLDDWLEAARNGLAAADADGDTAARAIARHNLAHVHTHRNQYEPATALFTEALALAGQTDWPDGRAGILKGLASVHWRSGRLTEAADCLDEALALARRTGSRSGMKTSLHNLGIVQHEMGHFERALACFTEALALATDGQRRASSLQELAAVHHELGDFAATLDHVGQALPLARELGDRGTEVDCLRVLAAVHRDAGRADPAFEAAEAALALSRKAGDPLLESHALNLLGTLHARFRRHARAAEYHERARESARAGGNRRPETAALIGLAYTAYGQGRSDDAVSYAERAVDLARAHGFADLEGHALITRAVGRLANADPGRAAEDARRAAEIQRETGHRLGRARALHVLGRATCALDGHEAAVSHWERALRLFTDVVGPECPEGGAARALLRGHGGDPAPAR